MEGRELRRGDLVQVRAPLEILATLDAQGRCDGLPFMPEMIQYCGKRFTVWKRADKLCDTVNYSGSRRLPDGVFLGNIRCDGTGHDGCQAACRLLWKTAWLQRVSNDAAEATAFSAEDFED